MLLDSRSVPGGTVVETDVCIALTALAIRLADHLEARTR
jgi:hypothetical protein